MHRVVDPSTYFLSFNLLSEIETDPIELNNHCLNLARSASAMIECKLSTAAQTFTLACFHGRPPKIVSLWDVGELNH